MQKSSSGKILTLCPGTAATCMDASDPRTARRKGPCIIASPFVLYNERLLKMNECVLSFAKRVCQQGTGCRRKRGDLVLKMSPS